MKRKISVAFLLLVSLRISAQIPTSCFEIESILVDACSAPEGENEMVRFRIGPNPLNVSNMNASWPNVMNLWLGVCQNATTALKVDTLNSSVQSCGLLIEPTGGILPTGAQVLLITSTNVQALAHSFANLSDTLYVIFQCPGNTAGHFGNFATGLRTLSMSFNPPAGCSDAVTYDRALLVNINDSTGGSTASQDGSSVEYAWDGTPTYYNNGCVAPFIPLSADAGNDTSVCEGNTVELNGSDQKATGRFWFSLQGSFDNSTILNPVFTPNVNSIYPIEIILNAYTSCDTISDTMRINKFVGAISAGNDEAVCNGQSTQLNGSGSNTYNWSTIGGSFVSNAQNPTVSLIITTTYILTGSFSTANCPDTDTVIISVNSKDSISISATNDSLCLGTSVTLTPNGASSYVWSPNDGSISDINSSSPSMTPAISTVYSVRSIGSCADTADFFVTVIPNDSIIISPADTSICAGGNVQLIASGGNSFHWSPSMWLSCDDCQNPVLSPADSIVYTVTSDGFCPSQADVSINVTPNITITALGDTTILRGTSATLTANGGTNYVWSPSTGLNDAFASSVIATPNETTTYFVTENNYSCALQASVTVTVFETECPPIAVPSAFTPNNDTKNDAFPVLNKEQFLSIEMRIFNRWGEQVFETNTSTKWDGSYKDVVQPIGTYAYVVTATCVSNGEKVQLNGCVTLLR